MTYSECCSVAVGASAEMQSIFRAVKDFHCTTSSTMTIRMHFPSYFIHNFVQYFPLLSVDLVSAILLSKLFKIQCTNFIGLFFLFFYFSVFMEFNEETFVGHTLYRIFNRFRSFCPKFSNTWTEAFYNRIKKLCCDLHNTLLPSEQHSK